MKFFCRFQCTTPQWNRTSKKSFIGSQLCAKLLFLCPPNFSSQFYAETSGFIVNWMLRSLCCPHRPGQLNKTVTEVALEHVLMPPAKYFSEGDLLLAESIDVVVYVMFLALIKANPKSLPELFAVFPTFDAFNGLCHRSYYRLRRKD